MTEGLENLSFSSIGTFAAFQVTGCLISFGSFIWTKKNFDTSRPIYLLALLDSIFSFIGFFFLFVVTVTIFIMFENDSQFKGIGNYMPLHGGTIDFKLVTLTDHVRARKTSWLVKF